MPPDPYVNYTGTQSDTSKNAGEYNRSIANVNTSFILLMPERANRVGFEIEAAVANTGTTTIRYGVDGTEFELVGGGAHLRSPSTGGVYTGDIYVKCSNATDDVIAREW